jgi:S-adenosylmethionine/arginine decarboxylase-like enzyme
MTPDVRHKHLVVRAEIASPPTGADTGKVTDWMRSLIEGIDMKIMFGPQAMYCEVEGNRGMTAFAIIETSHCAIHTWDECVPAIAQIDVYTCSDLNVEDVVARLDIFEPTKIEYKFLDREHGLTLLSEKAA